MSTRCQIGFYATDNHDLLDPDALLYRHSDGYPGTMRRGDPGVLVELVPFLKLFQQRRGLNDVEYAAAWTLHHLIDRYIHLLLELRSRSPSAHSSSYCPEDGKNCLGYGICQEFHGDIEYYYAVRGTTLKVYEVSWPAAADEPKLEYFRLLKTIELAGKATAPTALSRRQS